MCLRLFMVLFMCYTYITIIETKLYGHPINRSKGLVLVVVPFPNDSTSLDVHPVRITRIHVTIFSPRVGLSRKYI